MKKIILWVLSIVTVLMLLLVLFIYLKLPDRYPDYQVDINIYAGTPKEFQVGFSAVTITPEIPDTWIDANKDGRYFEEDGDTFEDRNGNGIFDAVWMAGFSNRRPANGIHDNLWARAMVIDDGSTRMALVAIDAIGFGNDEVIAVRELIAESVDIDYCIITASHTHEAPDLIGIWGESEFSSGVDPVYMEKVKEGAAESVIQAVKNMKPAWMRVAQDLQSADPFVEDSRMPIVKDPGVRLIQVLSSSDSTSLGTLFSWANHPEVLWDKNLFITSDFVHYVREYTEKGVYNGDSLIMPGLGGVSIYVNGAIGGLMTISPEMEIRDPVSNDAFKNPSFEKADALGKNLALVGLKALNGKDVESISKGSISLKAKSVELDFKNPLFRLAAIAGVIDRGTTGWFKIKSEVAYWTLGPMSFLHIPGEIYPEIVNGGVESPEGQDFNIDRIENPPLRDFMKGKYKFVVGLSNDLIGYIIPKSQWDDDEIPTYGYPESPYGEINSLGPETAPVLYREITRMIHE